MPIDDFARKIAAMVFQTELCASRMLGAGEVDALGSAFKAMDDTYSAVFEAERPGTRTRFRLIGALSSAQCGAPSPSALGASAPAQRPPE